MSSLTPQVARRYRHNQSEGTPSSGEALRSPRNPHYYNNHAHSDNSHPTVNYSQPRTPPKTPQKPPGSVSDNNASAAMGAGSSAKQRSKGNNRTKNNGSTPSTSRAKPIHPANQAYMSKPISTPIAPAYAGPTFHASPAPSTLPKPSFLSKSVPDSPSIKLTVPRTDPRTDEENSTSSDSSTPPGTKAEISERFPEESPLNLFFNADREEKARARSANSAVGPFQPPTGPRPVGFSTPASDNQSRLNYPKSTGGSASRMFAMELDGTPGRPYGPAFSTPYSERINAARSTSSPLNSPRTNISEHQKTTERSEALKSFLFSGQKPVYADSLAPESPYSGQKSPAPGRGQTSPPSSYMNSYSSPQQRNNGFQFINDGSGLGSTAKNASRTSGLRQEVTPTKSPNSTPERIDDIAFQTLNCPSYDFKENSVSRRHVLGGNLNSNQAPFGTVVSPSVNTSHIHKSDIRSMEDNLRRILKLEPSSAVSDTGITVAPASGPRF